MEKDKGFIYILKSSEITDLIKVEYTEGGQGGVSQKILGPYGKPALFEVVYKKKVERPKKKASHLRKLFLKKGVREKRDFFRISVIEAVGIIESVFENKHEEKDDEGDISENKPEEDEGEGSKNDEIEEDNKRGYIYVLENPEMPRVVKIGSTERSPEIRAEEISHPTGVPAEFEVAYRKKVKNPKKEELKIHKSLSKKRVSVNREFFRVSKEKAVERIDSLVGE